MSTTLSTSLEDLQAAYPRWKPDAQEIRFWLREFRHVHSNDFEEACREYRMSEKTNPSVPGLWKYVRPVQSKRLEASRTPSWGRLSASEEAEERRRIREDLDLNGDPIRDWLMENDPVFRREQKKKETQL